ncbi:hypothetical protein ACFO1B_38470 [Dactylosporangium siamense]|uniref:Uncharacterized protein n=1 Tax=Dactylosporangium siamense TaxID=685454 RepID=A0A919UBW3_9ACTN|nr:hypothetical protein [Dactylosporangium siamense]GIG49662.1 hypothetical protein Dsi01nite_077030 [Dactylosporangium siamense]
MAAECGIDDCGVLAIGRCRDCGSAFCMSHQGRNPATGDGYAALCEPCAARRHAAAAGAARNVGPVQRPGDEPRWVMSGQAVRDLVAKGVPGRPVIEQRRRTVKLRFGGERVEIDEIEVGTLWVAGRFEWTQPVDGVAETREWNTGLLAEPRGGYPVASLRQAVARCRVNEHGVTLVRDGGAELEARAVPLIAQAVRRLLDRPEKPSGAGRAHAS